MRQEKFILNELVEPTKGRRLDKNDFGLIKVKKLGQDNVLYNRSTPRDIVSHKTST